MLQQKNSCRVIYLAEDDDDDRILFLDAIKELHPEIVVKVSEDGQELINNLHNKVWNMPEIIFLDINMPCKNGFECLKEIRSNSSFNRIKIIMFSTSSSTLHIELSRKLGADYYAVKPGSFQEIRELLREIMAMDWNKALKTNKNFLLVSNKINTIKKRS